MQRDSATRSVVHADWCCILTVTSGRRTVSGIGSVPTCVVGTDPIPVVCARWCPTLPHPGGCSTIGAVRLSFRVRDGCREFPCRCDHRDDYMGSARPSSLVRLYSVVRVTAYPHTRMRVWLVVRVGCGPYSGRFAFTVSLTPAFPRTLGVWRVLGCCCLCWPISTSQLTDRYRSSTPGLSTQ